MFDNGCSMLDTRFRCSTFNPEHRKTNIELKIKLKRYFIRCYLKKNTDEIPFVFIASFS